jgi:hypothetical protein
MLGLLRLLLVFLLLCAFAATEAAIAALPNGSIAVAATCAS